MGFEFQAPVRLPAELLDRISAAVSNASGLIRRDSASGSVVYATSGDGPPLLELFGEEELLLVFHGGDGQMRERVVAVVQELLDAAGITPTLEEL